MSTGQSGPMIIAIGSRDDFLHVYQNDQDLLADHGIGAGEGESSGPIEFFDSDGHRLAGVYDQEWKLQRLTLTNDQPDPALVRQRVQNSVDQLRSYIRSHPEKAVPFGKTADQVLALIPDLGAASDFENFLKAFVNTGSDHEEPSRGPLRDWRPDPVHMYRHAGGWQH